MNEVERVPFPVAQWEVDEYQPALEDVFPAGRSPWVALMHFGHESGQEVRLTRDGATWLLKFRRAEPAVTMLLFDGAEDIELGDTDDPFKRMPALQLMCAQCGKSTRRRALWIERGAVFAASRWALGSARSHKPRMSITERRS